MNKKHLLALAMLAGVGTSALAEKHYLVKDGVLAEGVTLLDAGEDDYISEGKSPDGAAALLLTHVKQWSDARMYTEKAVNLNTHSKLVIDYYFDELSMGNYTGKYPAIMFSFGTDTIGGKYTRDDASHTVASIDAKFKHMGKEGKLVSDTAFIYARPDKAATNRFFSLSYDRDIEANDNVLYIKNIYLLEEERPTFAENFDPAGSFVYSDVDKGEKYVISKGETSLRVDATTGKFVGVKNEACTGGVALSVLDPDGKAFEESRYGKKDVATFYAPLKRRWEKFGSDVNTGSSDDKDQPIFTEPITVVPGAFYDTEIYHSLFVAKELAALNGSYAFKSLPIGEKATDLKVSFLAKWSVVDGEDIESGEDKTLPVFIKFDNSDELFTVCENGEMTASWTMYEGSVAIPSGATSFDIVMSPNANYSYNIDNLHVDDKMNYFKTGAGEGLDAGDLVVSGTALRTHVASIASDDANASAYFDGDNFIVKADEEIASISIIDMAGKTASVNGGEFNVSGFNKGIYVFVAKTVNGVSISGKIIIE